MINLKVANLLIPGDPIQVKIDTPLTTWIFDRHPDYAKSQAAMKVGACAETYFISSDVSLSDGAAGFDAVADELTPLFLGASYATGLTVTSRHSAPGSEYNIYRPTEYWPRDRAMDMASPVVNSDVEFKDLLEKFVAAWPAAGRTEKANLLIHHWLDALVCYSMEDLYLSATTLMQVIVATEAAKQGVSQLSFYPGVTDAASRFRLRVLSNHFKNMRNELIHDGRLIGSRFNGPDKTACAAVVNDVLNWLDEYIHISLNIGSVRKTRYTVNDFINLNAYSI